MSLSGWRSWGVTNSFMAALEILPAAGASRSSSLPSAAVRGAGGCWGLGARVGGSCGWRCLDGLSSCFQPLFASSQQEQPQLPGLGEALAWLPSEQETKQCGEAGGCSWQAGLFGFAAQQQELEPGLRQWGEDGEVQGVPGEKQGPVWVLHCPGVLAAGEGAQAGTD